MATRTKKVKRVITTDDDEAPKRKVVRKKVVKPVPEPGSDSEVTSEEEEPVMIKPKRKTTKVDVPEPEEKPPTRMFIESYTDLSFAVRGDTRPHADELRRFFGKFNPHLKGGGGWIFAVKHLEDVTKYIDVKNDGGDAADFLPALRPVAPRPQYQQSQRGPQPRHNPPPMSAHNPYQPQYPTLYEKGLQKAVMESNMYTAMLIWHQAGGDMEGFHNYVTEMSGRVFENVRADM
jgi:hypothetical protein